MKPETTTTRRSEPTLGQLFARISALIQSRNYNPATPLRDVLTAAELAALHEETPCRQS